MTRELRADMTTSHIPIILLTAKTTIESKLEGLEYGADDYITKPFSATYLQARVENLLMQRKKLQSFYRDSLMHINISTGQRKCLWLRICRLLKKMPPKLYLQLSKCLPTTVSLWINW